MIEKFFGKGHEDIGYTKLLHQRHKGLQEDARTFHRITRELTRFRGPLGYVGKKLLGIDQKRQEHTLRRAQNIGVESVSHLRELYDTISEQRERHREYIDRVKQGLENTRAYTGISAEDKDFIEECEDGLEKVLRGEGKELHQGLDIVIASLEQVEVLARQEGWHQQAQEDYRTYCKEAVLHYALHLIMARELLLVTDRVGRRVEHQNYLIQNVLDMMDIRHGVFMTSTELHKLGGALQGSEQIFGEAAVALRDLARQSGDPTTLIKSRRDNGLFVYTPVGVE